MVLVFSGAPLVGQLTNEQQVRAEHLEEQLMTPCCWKEPVRHHRSDAALTMKTEVRRMVAAGQSDREILDHYLAEYGARILVEPEGSTSAWMHIVPVLAVFVGLLVAIQVIRRWRKPSPAQAVS